MTLTEYGTGWRLGYSVPHRRKRLKKTKKLPGFDRITRFSPSPNSSIKESKKQLSLSGLFRARRNFYELACTNIGKFQYFATFTFDNLHVEDPKILLGWFNDYAYRNNFRFTYLGTFERGDTTGRWHFHALLSVPDRYVYRCPSSAYSKLPFKLKHYYSDDRLFYLRGYNYGFHSLLRVDFSTKLIRYITKYFDLSNRLGKHYYYRSRDLEKPKQSRCIVPDDQLNYLFENYWSKIFEYGFSIIGSGEFPIPYEKLLPISHDVTNPSYRFSIHRGYDLLDKLNRAGRIPFYDYVDISSIEPLTIPFDVCYNKCGYNATQ